MSMFQVGEEAKLMKPPHIVEGVIVMPGTTVIIQKINEDGSFDVLFYDRENMPHSIKAIQPNELQKI